MIMKTLLSNSQLDKLADVLINMGTVIFAVAVVPFFLKTEKIEPRVLFAGLALTFLCWSASIVLVRSKKR